MKKSKQALSAFAWLLAAVLLLAAVMLALPPLTQKAEEAYLEAVGGMELGGQAEGDAIALVSSEIPREQFEAYGVSPAAESAQVVKATAYPDNSATNSAVSWRAEWKNASSSWASGKTLSEYLTLSCGTGATESKTCTVSCLQAFGEPVTITVTADDNPSAQATVQADYIQKVTDYTLKFGTVSCAWGGNTDVTLELNESDAPEGGLPSLTPTLSSTYTIAADYTVTYTLSAGDSNQIFISGGGQTGNGVAVGFFTAKSGTSSQREKFDFSGYDVKSKGLYFGLKFMVTNMGFGGESHFMNSYTDLSYTQLLYNIVHAYDNDTSGEYTSWQINNLFRLTVKLTVGEQDVTKWTDFQATAYKNDSSITSVTVDKSNIYL